MTTTLSQQTLADCTGLCKDGCPESVVMLHAYPSAHAFELNDIVLLETGVLVVESGLCLKLEVSIQLVGVPGGDSTCSLVYYTQNTRYRP